MLQILISTYKDFRKFDDAYRDRRSENFPILSNPWHMFGLVVGYYIFVKHLGPKIMENRKAFELKWALLIYNMAQVLINVYMLVVGIYRLLVLRPYESVFCMMPNMGNDFIGRTELFTAYTYFLLKLVDYLDTVFFVLRKRYNQITFLHVYHHIIVSILGFVSLRYLPGGHGATFCLLNGFVHAIMYFYYFISALRPELKQSLWWKKYITQLQLVQFFILTVHCAISLNRGNCAYPRVVLWSGIVQNIFFMVLFSKFYHGAYMRKPSKMVQKSPVTNGVGNNVTNGNGIKKVK